MSLISLAPPCALKPNCLRLGAVRDGMIRKAPQAETAFHMNDPQTVIPSPDS